MPRYRLRAAARRDDWSVIMPPVHDRWFEAADNKDAATKAKNAEIHTWDHPTDVAWVVDESEMIVWIMTRPD